MPNCLRCGTFRLTFWWTLLGGPSTTTTLLNTAARIDYDRHDPVIPLFSLANIQQNLYSKDQFRMLPNHFSLSMAAMLDLARCQLIFCMHDSYVIMLIHCMARSTTDATTTHGKDMFPEFAQWFASEAGQRYVAISKHVQNDAVLIWETAPLLKAGLALLKASFSFVDSSNDIRGPSVRGQSAF